MSVIAELRIPTEEFELGRILEMEAGAVVELESMIPLGQKTVPFFWVHDDNRDDFEQTVQDHPSVEDVRMIDSHDDRVLYALEWKIERDVFFEGMAEAGAQLMSARGTSETWEFEIRFPSHDLLSQFREYCENAHIPLEVGRIYNPSKPGVGPWFGLTAPQRETLVRAVNGGYYAIPRGISTQELAEGLDISDQAVTERLRRAISTLVENTLLLDEFVEDDGPNE